MLKSVNITNLGGFDTFKAEFFPITIVSGGNEKGKSSLLRTVATIFEGGADAGLLKNGKKSGSADYLFSSGYGARKEIHPGKGRGYTVTVTDPNGGTITTGAQTKINEMQPKGTFDVRELLRMIVHDNKALEKYMLEHWPVSFSGEELNPVLRGMLPAVQGVRTLAEFNAMHTTLYDMRTNTRRDAKEAHATLNSLESTLVDGDGTDWGKEVERLNGELRRVASEISTVESDYKADAEQKRSAKRTAAEAKIKSIAAERTNYASVMGQFLGMIRLQDPHTAIHEISALGTSVARGLDGCLGGVREEGELMEELAEYLAKVDAAEKTAIAEDSAALIAEREKLSLELGVAQQKANQQQQSIGVRDQVEAQKKRLQGHVTKDTTLTTVLEEMDNLKAAKLREFPIEGIDVNMEDKKPVITINGKSLSENINTQNQIKIAIKFVIEAQRRAGSTERILVCEGAELDLEHLEEVSAICEAEGVQLIVSVLWNKQPLRVQSLADFKATFAEVGVAA